MKTGYSDEDKKLFAKNFRDLLDNWKKGEAGRTNSTFADEVNKRFYENPKNKNEAFLLDDKVISAYARGKKVPTKYMDAIASVFGVSVKYFFTAHSHEDKWRFDQEFITSHGKKLRLFADQIGLDLGFMVGMENIIDFSESFPLYAPMYARGILDDGPGYERANNGATVRAKTPERLFQVEVNGEIITMSFADLAFMKEIQEQTAQYVKFLFYQRKEEMLREEETVLKETSYTVDGVTVNKRLPIQYFLENDRFFKYVMEEKEAE